jgi:glycerol-3-phosphate dehydrogenase
VLGSGNFGTCLAYHLASLNDTVRVWSRDPSVANAINTTHKNPKYLRDVVLPDNLTGVGPEFTQELFEQTTVLLFCIPTQHLRPILRNLKDKIQPKHLLIFANKGIEMSTLLLPCDVIFILSHSLTNQIRSSKKNLETKLVIWQCSYLVPLLQLK